MANLTENQKKVLGSIKLSHNSDARNMPITENSVYHITRPETDEDLAKLITNEGTWDAVNTNEGIRLSVTALTRIGNGLPLNGSTSEDRLKELLSLGEDTNVITLTVTKVANRKALDPNTGNEQMRYYYWFKLA